MRLWRQHQSLTKDPKGYDGPVRLGIRPKTYLKHPLWKDGGSAGHFCP